ncbi:MULTISPECIES: hypothetical protein [Flammeovirga]|uniref:Uncharacterized protein n=1 Tax=Flammeovirga agarivorans TaxID=2726742 RepID=A0A7X8SG36_9BACT|nr:MULTISPECIES: hypothetical protein [Flammeovirga]NLR89610.1 hypothetical protein [Flammeovirga agarivorans]
MKHFVKPRVTATAQGNDYNFKVNIHANSDFELGVCAQMIQSMKEILIQNEIKRRGLKEMYTFSDEEEEERFYEVVEANIWDELIMQGEVVRDLGRSGYRAMDGQIRRMVKP